MTTRFPSSTPAARPTLSAAADAPITGAPPTTVPSPRRTTRRRLVRAWSVLAAIAVGSLATASLPSAAGAATGPSTAVPHDNEIVHARMYLSIVAADGDPVLSPLTGAQLGLPPSLARSVAPRFLTGEIERWSAVGPLRDRTAWSLSEVAGGPTVGTTEQSYADGELREWESWVGDVTTIALSDEERARYEADCLDRQRVWMFNVSHTADPIGGIRAMLDGGMLHNTGTTTIEGRSVLRLIGEEPGTEQNGSPGGPIAYEYLVDPSSFAPVRASKTVTLRGLTGPLAPAANLTSGYTLRWDFLEFEYLPLNDATRHLLVVGGGR